MSKRKPQEKNIGAGSLFGQDSRTRFLELTRRRYDSMEARVKKKGFPGLPFDLDGLRDDLMSAMGGKDDGAIVCRYCSRPMALEDCAADHATPLSRGGGVELTNVDYPCVEDNQRKGSLTLAEYTQLLAFLGALHPLARQDVLSRLQKAVQLAAGAFRNEAIIQALKANGEWKKAADWVNAKRKAKKQGRQFPIDERPF